MSSKQRAILSTIPKAVRRRTPRGRDGRGEQVENSSGLKKVELPARARRKRLSWRVGEPIRVVVASRKIRVLLVITKLDIGGATNVVLTIANHFGHHPDFDIELLAGPVPADRTDMRHVADEQGIPVHIVPSLINRISPVANSRAIVDIRRVMVQGDYDIVRTHSSVAGVAGRLAAWTAGVPVIVHHVHGWGLRPDMSKGTRMLYLGVERLCARFTSRFIAVCSPDIQKGLTYHIGQADKFTLIYNGIELDQFQKPVDAQAIRLNLGLDPTSKIVGMIGRLDEEKNPLDFIRAAATVSQSYQGVQFLVVGDGPLRPQCESLIDSLKLKDKFLLLGYRNDVVQILSVLTFTVMTSLWEGLPIAFLEAMGAGKPIVANDVDGAGDVVIDGETGFLVPPREPSKMAERILCLLNDEMLCAKMGRIAQQRSRLFSVNRMQESIESVYRELHFAAAPR